jgi:Sulfotransferase family
MKSKSSAIYLMWRLCECSDLITRLHPRSRINFAGNFLTFFFSFSGFTHRQMSTLNALSLNNTRRANNQIVVFNRVPKVGSQTFMELLRRLAIRNNFKFHRDSVQRVETIRLAPYQQEELAEMVSELPTPSGKRRMPR